MTARTSWRSNLRSLLRGWRRNLRRRTLRSLQKNLISRCKYISVNQFFFNTNLILRVRSRVVIINSTYSTVHAMFFVLWLFLHWRFVYPFLRFLIGFDYLFLSRLWWLWRNMHIWSIY